MFEEQDKEFLQLEKLKFIKQAYPDEYLSKLESYADLIENKV